VAVKRHFRLMLDVLIVITYMYRGRYMDICLYRSMFSSFPSHFLMIVLLKAKKITPSN
jgi:hypothetical protein